MSEEMANARRATFEAGDGWAHEGKKGWRCKISKMVEAGWTCDLSPETEDGATCFYCNLSLDGWEPKDDPLDEHKRRSPDCPFSDYRNNLEMLRPRKEKEELRAKQGPVRQARSADRVQSRLRSLTHQVLWAL